MLLGKADWDVKREIPTIMRFLGPRVPCHEATSEDIPHLLYDGTIPGQVNRSGVPVDILPLSYIGSAI